MSWAQSFVMGNNVLNWLSCSRAHENAVSKLVLQAVRSTAPPASIGARAEQTHTLAHIKCDSGQRSAQARKKYVAIVLHNLGPQRNPSDPSQVSIPLELADKSAAHLAVSTSAE